VVNLALIADSPEREDKPGLLSVEPVHENGDSLLFSSPTNLRPPFRSMPVAFGVTLALEDERSVFNVSKITGLVLGKVAAEFDLAPQMF